jgi:hypothetical protein
MAKVSPFNSSSRRSFETQATFGKKMWLRSVALNGGK